MVIWLMFKEKTKARYGDKYLESQCKDRQILRARWPVNLANLTSSKVRARTHIHTHTQIIKHEGNDKRLDLKTTTGRIFQVFLFY